MKRLASFTAFFLSAVLIFVLIPASRAAGVVSVVIEPPVITEYTNGYWHDDGGYFEYDVTPQSMTVEYSDGSRDELDYLDILFSGMSFSSDQSARSAWGVGTHTAAVTAGGSVFTYDVVIAPTSIETLTADRVMAREYTAGVWERYGDGARDVFFRYKISPGNFTATFKDGSAKEFAFGDLEYGDGFVIDPQSSSEIWGVGVHEVTVYCLGAPCTLEVEVTESPLASIDFAPVTIKADERLSEVSWISGDESGTYPVYDVTPSGITLNYKDGTTLYGTRYYLQSQTGEKMLFYDDQSRKNVWSVGTHTVRLVFMGKAVYYDVEITPPENPGDADGDTEITMKDVLIMRRAIAGLDEPSFVQVKRADTDYDGDITMKDVLRARRIIAGLD